MQKLRSMGRAAVRIDETVEAKMMKLAGHGDEMEEVWSTLGAGACWHGKNAQGRPPDYPFPQT
jgi:hypothetical protein